MAGLRPGFGFGGRIHVLLIDIGGTPFEPGMGAKGLLTLEGVAGVRTGGEPEDSGDVPLEEIIGWAGATLVRAILPRRIENERGAGDSKAIHVPNS